MNAEVFIKKASFLVNNCKDEALNLQYKVTCSPTWQSSCYSHIVLAMCFIPDVNDIVGVGRCAMPAFWIQNVNFWRLHFGTMNYHNWRNERLVAGLYCFCFSMFMSA